ncbi:MAG: sigma-70 family RNA polymerase sigma factor [Verrucomicrobia bacterium]|nr:sigma-70 family RNA polymerase sigma factor [Verrucomicrobiota bacterium]
MVTTRPTLLARLKTVDAHDAWREFFLLYADAIERYAMKLGLGSHQAEEVLQETMVALMRILPGFAYNRDKGKFRNFLLTIVHRKSLTMLRRVRREAHRHPRAVHEAADVADDPVAAEQIVRWREALLAAALGRLRDDPTLDEGTFDVFRAYAIEQQSATAVAAQFGLRENAVYQIKNRLLRRLQADVAELLQASGEDALVRAAEANEP